MFSVNSIRRFEDVVLVEWSNGIVTSNYIGRETSPLALVAAIAREWAWVELEL